MDIKDIKANNIEEFFGTLQQSVVESWRKHLKTGKYSEHIALNEFYEEMPDLVDDLIEAWMGINGKVKSYKNNFTEEKMGTIEYLETLKEFVENGKEDFMEEDELESLCDDILSQIDSTLYKIKELKENKFMDLKDFLTESIVQDWK
jgi:predicted transcriptional regulator